MTPKRSSPSYYQRSRFIFVALLMSAGFVAIAVRLVMIQGFQNEVWLKRAERQHEKNLSIEAERGAIYDRNGNVLAMSVEVPSVYAIPAAVRDPVGASRRLAPLLGYDPKTLAQKLRGEKGFVWLGRKLNPERVSQIGKYKIDGIGIVMESQRFYPKRALFGHLLGFAGVDNQGLEGIERKYDDLLRGERGWLVVERDAYGKPVFPKGFDYIAPSRGKDLYLTVDEVIQYISERELDRMIEKSRAKGGAVIVMDPWTGAILSMAVRPRFNPNAVGGSAPAEWRNRAITDAYEPGSTFKIVTAAAALEEKVVEMDEMIDCEEGAYAVQGTVIHDHEPAGVIPFWQVISKSSNVGTVKVAERLGEERLAAYARAFGFGERLGIDLSGESPGLLRPTAQWSKRSLASVAIGQEVGVTPLQMATAASAVANGGWLMTPHLIREAREPRAGGVQHAALGRVVRRAAPQARRRAISEETARELTRILQEVVSKSGTGPLAAIPGYAVAGKTGTAQKIDPATGRYSTDRFVSSFVGFVPADDPVVTILVMVDEPEGEAWGGSVAAPVFSAIGAETLRY
ncbi:MAG TPA: penicillin-binding protein 2, partial [Candidatus Manganitrophaceae bacterium]|nr:penicillin-binding protein 2 [Candidatus Manganitrophaceae bacterium]